MSSLQLLQQVSRNSDMLKPAGQYRQQWDPIFRLCQDGNGS
jgi:hypothetical protein